MRRKSQMHMGETIAIIIVLTFFVIFGLVFYVRIKGQDTQEKKDEYSELDIIGLATSASFLEELQCSTVGVTDNNCYDLLKIEAFQKIRSRTFFRYFDLFGNSKITIQQAYPEGRQWIIYDSNPPSFESINQVRLPINILDPLTGKQGFGVLLVEKYD